MEEFGGARTAKKQQYDQKLCSYLDKYTKCIVVHADNVGSNQLMMIRKVRRRDSPLGLASPSPAHLRPPVATGCL